jgi:hypothetical protein
MQEDLEKDLKDRHWISSFLKHSRMIMKKYCMNSKNIYQKNLCGTDKKI